MELLGGSVSMIMESECGLQLLAVISEKLLKKLSKNISYKKEVCTTKIKGQKDGLENGFCIVFLFEEKF